MGASRGLNENLPEHERYKNRSHFSKKLSLFSVDTTFEKIFFNYFRFRYAHAVFTLVFPREWPIFLVTCIMSLRRTVWAQRPAKVTFLILLPTPLHTWGRGDTFRKLLLIGISTVDVPSMVAYYSLTYF
jgi:hypothetical protein